MRCPECGCYMKCVGEQNGCTKSFFGLFKHWKHIAVYHCSRCSTTVRKEVD